MKKLTQEVFENAPDWVRSAAVDENGVAHYFSVFKRFIVIGNIYGNKCWLFDSEKIDHTCRFCKFERIDGRYDTTNWQNSAIDREVKP